MVKCLKVKKKTFDKGKKALGNSPIVYLNLIPSWLNYHCLEENTLLYQPHKSQTK